MACSWGAEELGTLGSSEWADENGKFLRDNVVAYLNADMLVYGDYMASIRALEFLRGKGTLLILVSPKMG